MAPAARFTTAATGEAPVRLIEMMFPGSSGTSFASQSKQTAGDDIFPQLVVAPEELC